MADGEIVVPLDDVTVVNDDSPENNFKPDQTVFSWDSVNVYDKRPAKLVNNSKVGCFGKPGKHILKNVSGYIRFGELLAMIGASGAGKTTLLNVLHFNSGGLYVEGALRLNGEIVDAARMSSISAYVQQEDLFISTLTVREHLIFTARVKMSPKIPYKKRVERVDEVIHELGLSKCKDRKIGHRAKSKGISGGERKRLAFASEYLTDPIILFCDEPTTGLDSFMAQSVVEVMQNMAKSGKAVVCTIHQPASEVFEMFDHIYLLSGGRTVYAGTTPEALDFFSTLGYPCPMNSNPADFFIFTLATLPGDEEKCIARATQICDAYRDCPKHEQVKAVTSYQKITPSKPNLISIGSKLPHRVHYTSGWFRQFAALLQRSLLCVIRDPLLGIARSATLVAVALLLSLVYFRQVHDQAGIKNLMGCLVLIILNQCIMNGFSVISVVCAEYPVFLREHFNGMYRSDVYYITKVLVEMPFVSLNSILSVSVLYYTVGLNDEFNRFLWCCLICTLLALCACGYGYLMATSCKNIVVAYTVAPVLFIPLILYNGFLLRLESVPSYMRWIKDISMFYYSNELLFVNEFDSNVSYSKTEDTFLNFEQGSAVLQFFGFSKDNWNLDMGLVVALWAGQNVLAYICLFLRTWKRS